MFIPKWSQNQYLNNFSKDICKTFRKNVKTLLDLLKSLDPIVEFVRWCPYFELETLKFFHKEMCTDTEHNYIIKIFMYISHIPHILWNTAALKPATNKWYSKSGFLLSKRLEYSVHTGYVVNNYWLSHFEGIYI